MRRGFNMVNQNNKRPKLFLIKNGKDLSLIKIRRFLALSLINFNEDDVQFIYDEIGKRFNQTNDSNFIIKNSHIFYWFQVNMPDIVLYYERYLTIDSEKLNPIIIYLIVERLQKKRLSADIQTIHELCYLAYQLFENKKVINYTHGANYVIRIYERGAWVSPNGFFEEFPMYEDFFQN